MKPRWHFVAGSVMLLSGLVGLSMGIIFLVNLSVFLIRRTGPLATWRLQSVISTFPWWIPIFALAGIILAIRLLKKYDFSYKKDFPLLIIAFVISVFLAGFLLDALGLNRHLSGGRMRKFYQQIELEEGEKGSVKGIYQHNRQLNTR
ncbi:hypothetical protein KA005_43640 [bacterium]|nr:hypothetical protein [bacterium]